MEPDFNSPTWKWLEGQLRAEETRRLAALRTTLGIEETNVLRGQLLTTKLILGYPESYKRNNT